MGVKPIETKLFIEFLKSLGLVFIRKDQNHHDLYDYPDGHEKGKLKRPLSVRTNYKDIPILHIHTNLQNAGVKKSDFEAWLRNPKKTKRTK